MSRHPAYRGPWQTVRKRILERDNHTCQIRGPKCTTTATHVDHIIPTLKGGAWYDPDNLRAACKNCNLGRIDRTNRDRWQTAQTHITLIIGPPGTPKQPDHTQPGDLIIDYDQLTDAIGGNHPDLHGPALKARGAILGELRRGAIKSKRAFIVSSNPKAETLFPYHTIKLVDPGIDQAKANAERSARATGQRDITRAVRLVDEWYRVRHTGSGSEMVNSRKW